MASSSKSGNQKHKHSKDNKSGKQSNRPDGKGNQPERKRTFIEQIDRFMEPRLTIILIVSLFFTLFFGIFLFDVKISTGGDDSSYIEMAHNFLKGISFPSWHGPLYPILLSIPISVFGVNVIMLKLISFTCIIGHLIVFYYTFRKHFSPTLFALIMLIVSVSSAILYFASQTYSEALYLLLQSIIVFLFVRYFIVYNDAVSFPYNKQIRQLLIIGFLAFFISLTRNIGIVVLLVLFLYLIIQRRYWSSLLLIVSYVIFYAPYRIYKALVWNTGSGRTTGQISEILLKNTYNRAEGYENFSGMVVRFFENARLYLSKHFMIGIGLHDPASTDKNWFVTVLIIVLFLITLIYAIRRSRIMLFIAIYVGASLAATFIALQTSWDQMRMVVIYIPMMLVILSWGILQLSSRKGYGFLQVVLVAFLVLVFFKTTGQTVDKMKTNRKVLAENIRGNKYYGFTPDWQNYLKMSEWVGENIADSVGVASRKPSMSFIYSKGHDFHGIYRLPVEVTDELIGELKNKNNEGLFAIFNNELQELAPEYLMYIKSHAWAFVTKGDDLYGIYPENEQFRYFIDNNIGQQQISTIQVDSLMLQIQRSGQSTYAVSPDTLLQELINNRVEYVILASLRVNPNLKTERTINTVQRFLYFIEQKYPGIFTFVYQVGDANNEPAWLYRINYRLYNL